MRKLIEKHADFLLLLLLFVTFRLSSILFFRTGGYIRDYSDLIFYQGRARWQDYGLFPYRDYWSEYPPLFSWISVAIDRISRMVPLWEDERLWYGALFGLVMLCAETVTFVSLYRLAILIHPTMSERLRVCWLYAGLFVPVYLLGGWYDALPVATIFAALALLPIATHWWRFLLFGLLAGIGGLLKLVPLAILAIVPLAIREWHNRILAIMTALTTVGLGYGFAFIYGPTMTYASLHSLAERSGWSTIYALVNDYWKLGYVPGDRFDPMAEVALFQPVIPSSLFLAVWVTLGASLFIVVWRHSEVPQSPLRLIQFGALTYTILLLAYPAWNPQYSLYLLPFLVLIWPNLKGLFYALVLSLLVLAEHPIYFNLIAPAYPPNIRAEISVEIEQLLLPIVLCRTVLLLAMGWDWVRDLFAFRGWTSYVAPFVTAVTLLAFLSYLPSYARGYYEGRVASSQFLPLIHYLNAQQEASEQPYPIVTQQLAIGRELRPFLQIPQLLQVAGGRPGRLDPLPALINQQFLYLHFTDDNDDLLRFLATDHRCDDRYQLSSAALWFCNDAMPSRVATFTNGIRLLAPALPDWRAGQIEDPLSMRLFWATQEPVTTDYTVFVHIVDAQGRMIGQHDQMPNRGQRPTSGWQPGELIVDPYRISLALGEAAGPIQLWVGLYDAQSGARLPVVTSAKFVNEERIELATFRPFAE